MQEASVQSLGWENPLVESMATHSSSLAWRISWTEEPGGLQSMGWQRVGAAIRGWPPLHGPLVYQRTGEEATLLHSIIFTKDSVGILEI